MKYLFISLLLLSFQLYANVLDTPLVNVLVTETKSVQLSILNQSSEVIELDIYGEALSLVPASGLFYNCTGYNSLEITVLNNSHDFFEVPCSSKITFKPNFTNQFKAR